MNTFIGIDPGSASGGLCVISRVIETFEFKKMTEKDIYTVLEFVCGEKILATIEKVHAFPQQGVSSVFKFGQNYGFLKGVLTALQIPYEEVSPQAWIKYYGMKKNKDESKHDWKKRLRQKAEQLYPNIKITANTADAILIANYCKNMYNKKLF